MHVIKENLTPSRLNIRIHPDIKERIQRAARILGQDLTEFTSNVLNREAKEIIDNHEQILLSEQEYDWFIEALDRPARTPSKRSLRALKEYREVFGDRTSA